MLHWSTILMLVYIGKGVRQGCILSPCLFNLYAEYIMRRRQWHPTPVLLPGESHGWRSLVSYSPRGRKESDTTERLYFTSLRKGRGTRDQIVNIHWIREKAREFQKNIDFCFIDYKKASDCVDQQTAKNSERDGDTRPPYLPPEKPICGSRSNS